jgi:hypothetical protein
MQQFSWITAKASSAACAVASCLKVPTLGKNKVLLYGRSDGEWSGCGKVFVGSVEAGDKAKGFGDDRPVFR